MGGPALGAAGAARAAGSAPAAEWVRVGWVEAREAPDARARSEPSVTFDSVVHGRGVVS